MRSAIDGRVFSEPDGPPETYMYFLISVTFLSTYGYFTWALGSADPITFPLVMGVGFALGGIAESLPENRRQTAGVLRLTAMLVYLCVIVATVFVPELLFG